MILMWTSTDETQTRYGRVYGRMVVSTRGAFLGTKVDSSVRIIHVYKQAKRSAQLPAMLNGPAYIDDESIWPFPKEYGFSATDDR